MVTQAQTPSAAADARRPGLWWRLLSLAPALGYPENASGMGDFTTSVRIVPITVVAVGIGVLGSVIALALLRLIGFFTNLFFFGQLGTDLVSPAGNDLGSFVILVPVAGAIVIGFMARYGSERIRGHGIPEAIEAILINGSRVDAKVAVLKPLSSALSIGSGGPFGAEGPIIMTGGAFGSLVAQFLRLSGIERRTLLVAGAAAGMSAVFATPVAAVLLAVELLLFEWKPRSVIPVAMASATAAAARYYMIGEGPLFPVPVHTAFVGPEGLLACLALGILAGALSSALTAAVYAAEDAFRFVPIHWMWWPALGGLAIGIGGLIYPDALGVGYDRIEAMLNGDGGARLVLGMLIVKSLIWAIALGSGTSGGVLAPLLLMGGALGLAVGGVLPDEGTGFWPLIAMGAILGGTMRSPFTGIVFIIELTRDVTSLLPLLVAAMAAFGFTVLVMRRSILTEKLSRRGYHLSREYTVDPLESLRVRDVMRTEFAAIPAETALADLQPAAQADGRVHGGQHLYPVVQGDHQLVGVVTRSDLQRAIGAAEGSAQAKPASDAVRRAAVVAYPGETLRGVVYRMAKTGLTRFPVVEGPGSTRLVGLVGLTDLLKARTRTYEEEHRRERMLRLRLAFRRAPAAPETPGHNGQTPTSPRASADEEPLVSRLAGGADRR